MKKYFLLLILISISSITLVSATDLVNDAQFFYSFDNTTVVAGNVTSLTTVPWSCVNNGTISSNATLSSGTDSWVATAQNQACARNISGGWNNTLTKQFWIRYNATINATAATSVYPFGFAVSPPGIQYLHMGGAIIAAGEVLSEYDGTTPSYTYWGNFSLTNNTWHQILIISNTSSVTNKTLWVDGVQIGDGTRVGLPRTNTSIFNLGGGPVVSTIPYVPTNFSFDNVGFWNSSFNSSDIATMYAAGAGYNPFSPTVNTNSFSITAKSSYSNATITDFYANVTWQGMTELNLHTTNTTLYLYPLFDMSGNNMTANGNATYNISGWYNFNNQSSQQLESPVFSAKTIGNYSISAWLMPFQASQETSSDVIGLYDSSNGNAPLEMRYTGTTLFCTGTGYNSTSSSVQIQTSTYSPAASQWMHALCTTSWDGSIQTISMYINGTLYNSSNKEAITGWERNFTRVRIGRAKTTFNRAFNGSIDQARYFNITVNSSDAVNVYNNLTTTGLNASWPFVNVTQNGTFFNANASSPLYFRNSTTNINTSSSPFQFKLFQAQVAFAAYEIISGNPVTTFTATILNITDSGTPPTLYLDAGSYNATFNKSTWFNSTSTFTVQPLENTTENFTVYQTILNITAINNISGVAITSFNLTLSSGTYSYNVSAVTTNGSVIIPWLSNDTISIVFSSGNLSTTNHNITVNGTGIQNFTLQVYATRSILFRVFDEQNQTLVNTTNVTIGLSGTSDSRNFTFSNGTFFISLLAPQEYLITYSASNYPIRTYYYTVTDNSTAAINLYMLVNSSASATLHTVRDVTNSRVIPDAYIYLMRKNLTGTNSFIVEICKTDGNGQCVMQAELVSAIYNVLIIYQNETVYNSGNTEFATTEKTWNINLQSRVLSDFFAVQGFNYNLTYTNTSNTSGFFYYSYLDSVGFVDSTCVTIIQRNYSTQTVLNGSCTSGTAGAINLSFTIGGQETCAYSYIVADSQTYGVKQLCVVNTQSTDSLGGMGLFYIVIPTLLVVLFLFRYDPRVAIVAGMFIIFVTWMINLLPTTVGAISLIIGAGALYAMRNHQ